MPNLPARWKGRTGVNLGRRFPGDHTAFVLPPWKAESSVGGLVPGLQFLKGPRGPYVPRIIPVCLYHLFIHLYTCPLSHPSISLSVSIYPSTHLPSCPFICLSIYISIIHPSIYLPVHLVIHLSVYLSTGIHCFIALCLFIYASPHSMWDLSPLTRD